jgi:hypothetical protein
MYSFLCNYTPLRVSTSDSPSPLVLLNVAACGCGLLFPTYSTENKATMYFLLDKTIKI